MNPEYIYYDLQTDKACRGDYSALANDNVPVLRYKNKRVIYWQFLKTAHKTNGVFDDFDTSLAAVSIAASAAVDNNAVHYYDGVPNAAITGGAAITTIAVKSLTGIPRICGRIRLTNASGDTDTIYYNGYSVANSVYTFTLSNSSYVVGAQTPVNSYNSTTSTARVLEPPIVKDAAVDCTNKATGLYVITLDCYNLVYQDEIEGETEIQGTVMELTVTQSGPEDVYVKTVPVKCRYKLDDDGVMGPAPADNYYLKTDINSTFEKIISGTQTTLTDNATTNIVIYDKTLAGAADVFMKMVGAAGARVYGMKLGHFGSTAYNDGGSYMELGTALGGTITIACDISSNDVRLNITLASVGENLKLVHRSKQLTLES